MNPSDKYEQIKDIKRLNPVELEAMVLNHAQQMKDIAAHLLELKRLVTPMMEFKQDAARMERRYIWAVNALMAKDYGEPDVTQSSPQPPA